MTPISTQPQLLSLNQPEQQVYPLSLESRKASIKTLLLLLLGIIRLISVFLLVDHCLCSSDGVLHENVRSAVLNRISPTRRGRNVGCTAMETSVLATQNQTHCKDKTNQKRHVKPNGVLVRLKHSWTKAGMASQRHAQPQSLSVSRY